MSEQLDTCPFCGGEAVSHRTIGFKDSYYVACLYCASTSDDYETEQEAISAWNTRHEQFEVPEGYVLMPVSKLDDMPVFKLGIENGYDISEAVNAYGKYLSDKLESEILKQSLNKAGWFKERTCRIEGSEYDDLLETWTTSLSCGHNVHGMFEFDGNYCQNCGAKVVE